jgi:hypothetical protein
MGEPRLVSQPTFCTTTQAHRNFNTYITRRVRRIMTGHDDNSENRPLVPASLTLPSSQGSKGQGASSPLQFSHCTATNQPLPSPSQSSDAGYDDSKSAPSSVLALRKPAVYPNNLAQKQSRRFARR